MAHYAEDNFESYTDDDRNIYQAGVSYINVFGRNGNGSNGYERIAQLTKWSHPKSNAWATGKKKAASTMMELVLESIMLTMVTIQSSSKNP